MKCKEDNTEKTNEYMRIIRETDGLTTQTHTHIQTKLKKTTVSTFLLVEVLPWWFHHIFDWLRVRMGKEHGSKYKKSRSNMAKHKKKKKNAQWTTGDEKKVARIQTHTHTHTHVDIWWRKSLLQRWFCMCDWELIRCNAGEKKKWKK